MDFMDLFMLLSGALLVCMWWRYWSGAAKGGGAKNLPPGPPGWPLVGNLFQVILQRKHFIFVVGDLRAKYGPIFTMQMGQRTLIIITSPELIHEALVRRGHLFASRPADSPIRLLFSVGKCALNSAPYGPLWRTLRRNFVTEMITPARIKQCSWIRSWALQKHIKRLHQESSDKGFVEVMVNCRQTICSILICLCFGAKISEDWIKEIECILKDVMMVTTPKLPDFLPVFSPLFRQQVKEAKKLRARQLDCLIPLIRARKAFVEENLKSPKIEMVSPVGAAYVDSLFKLQPQGRGKLSEEEIVTLCSETISAGTDTSTTTVEWALLRLVTDQEMQEKLYREIVDVVGKNGVISEEDVENMPYLIAIVKETFRRHPPSHFVLSHASVEETELSGYTIPRDAYIEFYTAWITRDPSLWEDPDAFRPERFLASGDGVDVDITGTRGPAKMLPFGAGRRICPAWTLGTLHVHLLLARMVREFKWLPIPDNPPDPTETYAFTVVMKDPLKAIILPRTKI